MKRLLFFILLLITTIGSAQNNKIMEFPSNELNEVRILKIHIPASYKEDGDRVYPLTILLDSEHLFDVYVANAKLFAKRDKAPEQIIVGISQNQKQPKERYQDCSYNKVNSMPSEKGMAFYKFISEELLGYLDGKYRISPFKTIVGNTLTANYNNYFLLAKEPVFQAYVNLNPSYASDMLSMLHKKIPTIEYNTYYYTISGNYNGRAKQQAIKGIDNLLKSSQNDLFEYRYDEVNYSTKTASIGHGISESLAFIFDSYSAISKEEFKNKVSRLSPPKAIEYLEKKYVEIEYLFGANIKIRERDIYAIEGIIIDKENGEYLRDFGEMIYKLFPESPLGDYYIGLGFELNGKFKRALEAYKEGYMKIEGSPEDADLFYKNVERVAQKVK